MDEDDGIAVVMNNDKESTKKESPQDETSEDNFAAPAWINNGDPTKVDKGIELKKGIFKVSFERFIRAYDLGFKYENFMNSLGANYKFEFEKIHDFMEQLDSYSVIKIGYWHPLKSLKYLLKRELADEAVSSLSSAYLCCLGFFSLGSFLEFLLNCFPCLSWFSCFSCFGSCGEKCPALAQCMKIILLPFILLRDLIVGILNLVQTILKCVYNIITCPIQALYALINWLITVPLTFCIFFIVEVVFEVIKKITLFILDLFKGCLLFMLANLLCCKRVKQRPIVDQNTLARQCKMFAYSCNMSEVCDPTTRIAAKMNGLGRSMDLMRIHMKQNARTQETRISEEEMKTLTGITKRIEKDQAIRNTIEIEAPKTLFKNVFGDTVHVGDVSGKKTENVVFELGEEERALAVQLECLQNILMGYSTDKTTKTDQVKNEYLLPFLNHGTPSRLRADILKILDTDKINFSIKSKDSIMKKIRKKSLEENKHKREIMDLNRCRVIVNNIHETWSNISNLLLSNLSELSCNGIIIRMKGPKQKDEENVEMESEGKEETKGIPWHGLYLYLFYDGIPVEVQVMSVDSFLSFGTTLTGLNRKEREKDLQRISNGIEVQVDVDH